MAIPDDTIYQQLCEDFRSLNGILWQMPVIAMTLTGGLWLGIASFPLTEHGRHALLSFAAAADLVMILALFRLRYVMLEVQRRVRLLDGGPPPRINYVIVGLFSILLLGAGSGSWRAGQEPARYFRSSAEPTRPDEAPTSERMTSGARHTGGSVP